MSLTKARGSLGLRPRHKQTRLRALAYHERRRLHLDSQYSHGQEDARAGGKRAASAADGVQTTSGAVPPLADVPSSTATRTTSTTTNTTTVTPKVPATTAARKGLEGVFFVNPDAVLARVRRREKLDAARARMASLAPRGGGDSNAAGQGHRSKEIRLQERVLRNRESAALSRKRRNNRVGELEIQVEALEEENRRLRLRTALLERGGGGVDEYNEVNPPPLPTTTRPPRAVDKAPVNIASTCIPTAPIIFPAASSSSVVDEKVRGRQAAAGLLPVPLPAVVVEQAWTGGGTRVGSAVVGCAAQQQVEARTHDGTARPSCSDSSDFCSDSSDAEETIGRLFVALMAEEAADREEGLGAASSAMVGAVPAVLHGGKGRTYARFDQNNGARRGILTPPGNVSSVFYWAGGGQGIVPPSRWQAGRC